MRRKTVLLTVRDDLRGPRVILGAGLGALTDGGSAAVDYVVTKATGKSVIGNVRSWVDSWRWW